MIAAVIDLEALRRAELYSELGELDQANAWPAWMPGNVLVLAVQVGPGHAVLLESHPELDDAVVASWIDYRPGWPLTEVDVLACTLDAWTLEGKAEPLAALLGDVRYRTRDRLLSERFAEAATAAAAGAARMGVQVGELYAELGKVKP